MRRPIIRRGVVHLRAPLDHPNAADGRLCRGLGGGGSATSDRPRQVTCRSCLRRFARDRLRASARARSCAEGWIQMAAEWLRQRERV